MAPAPLSPIRRGMLVAIAAALASIGCGSGPTVVYDPETGCCFTWTDGCHRSRAEECPDDLGFPTTTCQLDALETARTETDESGVDTDETDR